MAKRVRLSSSAWQEVMARQAGSGVPIPAFCARESLNLASFYRWRSKLDGSLGAGRPKASRSFVDLGEVGGGNSPSGHFSIRLELGGGVVLHLARG